MNGEKRAPEAENGPPKYNRRILFALNAKRGDVYGGTVAKATISKRRAANRVARKSRATNRKGK
jgi:hypothetical protein